MKHKLSLVAGLGLVCLSALGVLSLRSRLTLSPDAEESRVTPVVASLSEIGPIPTTTLRPNRIDEGSSRIESSFTEAEILELIAQAHELPPDPDIQVLDSSGGGLTFTAGTSFDSIDVSECCLEGGLNPPDPEIAVGRDHVVAVVNAAFEVYDKAGTSLFGPLDLITFFSVLGEGCTSFPFDPNVLYDESADRYIIAADGDFAEYCVAVSQTGDATGMYNFYAFPVDVDGDFFDFPHAGVGVDAIYVGANMSAAFGRIFAFDKAAMYAGAPAAQVSQKLGGDRAPQPMNIKGTFPTDGKHYIITTQLGFNIFPLYSWEDPFGANIVTSVATFDLSDTHGVTAGFGVDSPQADGVDIESIDPRPLDFEYRDGFAWMTNLVSCNPGAGTVNCVQWAQIDVGAATVQQAGVFATDSEYRIYPDLAVDGCGNMLVGYTKTSSTTSPGVWVAGRQAADPPGTIQGELELKAGETPFGLSRWGDYTGMTLDPDGVTFWYFGEYSKIVTSSANWGTFIGSASFDDCTLDSIFTDGFESGDTSRWSSTSP